MRLCLFGGAFNPPHRTHERVIRAALTQLPIDRLIVIPSGQHPHKAAADLAPAAARLELAHLAFDGIAQVEVDDWEIRRRAPSYTVDTVKHFREYDLGGERPYWVLGADNLATLTTWHRYDELLELAVIVTCPRKGRRLDDDALSPLGLRPEQRAEILAHVLDLEPDDVAASAIREQLARGAPADQWLVPAVAARIRELGLYGTGAGA